MMHANDNRAQLLKDMDAKGRKLFDQRFFQLCMGGLALRDADFDAKLRERFSGAEVNEWKAAADMPVAVHPKARWGMAR